MDFDGRIALVTGATSGIGRATAVLLAARGASVLVNGRNRDAADEVIETIAAGGGRGDAVLGDVSDSTVADRLVADAVDAHGRVDVVVNAAGVITRADAPATTDEEWHRVMRINVDGTFFVSRAAVTAMRASGGGSIVNVSSTCGVAGAAGLAAYCASKGAVTLLTQAMALDHAAEGIRINAVCPGAVDTPMLASGRENAPMDRVAVLESNVASIPQGRVPTPDEVARVIAFLASDDASHVVGVAMAVDGGYLAQ